MLFCIHVTWIDPNFFLLNFSSINHSQLRDEELSKESQESNWFSAPSALRVYGERISV